MRVKILVVLFALGTLVLGACSARVVEPIPLGETGPGDPVRGAVVYRSSCATCHARDLQGIDGLGGALAPNTFVAEMTEEEIAAFLAIGRSADDPDNMVGMAMPARGGNPSLTDQDLRDVAAYLKAQQ